MGAETSSKLNALLRMIFWQSEAVVIDVEVLEEMNHHAIAALAAPILQDLDLPSEILIKWEKISIKTLARSAYMIQQEKNLPITVPYVILKGSSAAQYYPMPEFRAQGDIDIMTRREDFDKACEMLLKNGYHEIKDAIHSNDNRHREFAIKGVTVEVHAYFASLNDPVQAEYLDDLIIGNITSSHVLPDPINGLVLLEHISQHMEHGLGLRQIIDWMMFVDKCLPDDKWPEFQIMADGIGLQQLAKVTTRMCEIYLGLPARKWCADATEDLCVSLMEYVFNCGNFGNKWKEKEYRSKYITYSRTPKAALRLFHDIGVQHWKAARKYMILRPLATMYQAGRLLMKGFIQRGSVFALKSELDEARKRNKMFDALGVKQRSKGLVVYKNGKYMKG